MVREIGRSSVRVHTAAAFFAVVNGESRGDKLLGSPFGHRRKGSFAMKRRILAFLLALVMVVGMVPTSVFADMAEEAPEEVTSVIEEAGIPEEEPEEAEEPPAEPEEEPEEREEVLEEELEELPEENFALEAAASDVHVTFTVSVQGVLGKTSDGKAAVELPVTVEDLNSDGILTYDEALTALHTEYCPDGYSQTNGTVKKLWGKADTFYKFWKNGEYLTKMVNYKDSTVAEGDKLYAAVVKDAVDTSDVYASFDKTEVTVEAGESFALKLTGKSNEYFSGSNVAGAVVGTWENGTFTALKDTKTDYVGKVTLSFDKAGTYIVSASGTVAGESNDPEFDWSDDIDCPITAPYCVVTVNGAEKPAATADVTFTISNQGVLAQTPDGKDVVELPVTVVDLNGDDILTFDEANVALHEAYCPGGYKVDGTMVTNFWNEQTKPAGSYLFTANDDLFSDAVPDKSIKAGDKLYVAILKDQTTWSDAITFFDQKALTVDAGQEFTLNLQGGTSMGLEGYTKGNIAGAQVGTWKSGKFTALDGAKTDEKGNVTLKLTEGGTYVISANGTIKADIANWAGGNPNETITVDAPISAPYCIVTVNEAEVPVTTVTVNFKMQDDEGGQFITAFGEEVSSDLAESYGFTDRVKDGVSALDVLVRAHEMAFDGAIDQDNIRDFLDVNDQGFITVYGSMETMAVAIIVNGQLPGNGSYTVNQAKVEDNDTVFFGMYADTSSYSDRYVWLETADGQRLTGQTLYAGATVDLVVKGMSAMMGGEGTPAAGLKLGYVNMATGEVTDLGATSDGNGKLSYTIPEGAANRTFCLTVSGDEIMGELSVFKVGDVAKETDLVDIQLAIGGRQESTIQPLTLSPEFEHTTRNYTVDALDYIEEDNRYLWVKVEAIPYCTASFDFHGVTKDFKESELRQWRRLDKLTPGVENVLTLTSAAEGGYTRTYTVTVPMEGDMSDQSIVWNTDLTEDTAVALGGEKTLTVEAALSKPTLKPKTIAYQWYSNTTASTEGGKAIEGATGASYKVPTDAKGKTYYYAVASCGSLTATSGVVSVWVATAPKSITLTSDYPYTADSDWVKALDGKTYYADSGQRIHVRAVDENGDDAPVKWKVEAYGGTFDAKTGIYTVNYASNCYLTATSLIDPTVASEEKALQVEGYKFSTYQKTQTRTLSSDGQTVTSTSVSGGVDGHNTWTLDDRNIAAITSDLTKGSKSVNLELYRPGVVNVTFTADVGPADLPKLTDTATITVTGVGVETVDGTRSRVDLEISTEDPAPTASLAAYLMEGRTLASWTSTDDTVATVDDNGVVTAKGVGSAIITATDDQGSKGGIKIVVTDAANPTFETLAFTSGWGVGVRGLTFKSTTYDYTGLSLVSATSKLEFAATTRYSNKLEAVATYTDEKGAEQTVAVASGSATNLLPNIAFGTSTLTLTLSRKDNKDVKSVYTFEITRPRDTSKANLNYTGGLTVLSGDGSALRADLYKNKAEGFLFNAKEDGTLIGTNYSFSNSTYFYRTYLQDARESFTLNTKSASAYSHIRYSVDDGEWTELAQGGGRTAEIKFPAAESGNAVVKVTIQLVNDSVYTESGNAFPETVEHNQNGIVYTVWAEQLPSLESLKMLTAQTETGYWYPAFSSDHFDYSVSVAHGESAPALTYTIADGLTVTVNGEAQTPDESGTYTLALNANRQAVKITSSDGEFSREYSFYCAERAENTADKVVDALTINSQYTNVSYGLGLENTLTGKSLKSLGNFGGYITFYFEDGLKDDPTNKYGVDFYIDGNAFVDTTTGTGVGSMEPGQVWVSEDGETWYALAGSEHYGSAIWDYTVTYTKDGDGTHWSDNYGNTDVSSYGRAFKWPLAANYPLNSLVKNDTITLSGILLPSNKGIVGTDDFSTTSSGARFGYVDTAPNGRNNPYADNRDYKNESSGFDLSWAVDASGNPVDVNGKEFHYVKVVTASNILAGAINEKSTEVSGIYRAVSTGSEVGTTAAPTAITFTENGGSYTLELEKGKQVYELTLPMDSVSIRVDSDAENVYVNNQWIPAGEASTPFAVRSDKQTLVRVIVQTGEEEPTIVLLKLTGRSVTEDDKPIITQQPQSASYMVGQEMQGLAVEAVINSGFGKVNYQWFENTENTTEGAIAIEGATASTLALGTAKETGTKYYFCVATGAAGADYSATSDLAEITVLTAEEMVAQTLGGTGTSEDPYQISKAEDYVFVGEMVAAGYSFAGQYLAQTADVTLPEGWTPIGCLIDPSVGHINGGKNARFFSGHLDGQSNTLTVPEGGLPLFAYVTDAYVQNLNIYGSRIEGYGLVNNLEGVGLKGNAITIDGVTLLSGTRTLKSGLIGTYITKANGFAGCSGAYLVTIRNCVAEEGVVIGYDGTESNIGTFAGRVNGTIENCESYATVQGVDNVGGIAGILDNSYTTFNITGCTFGGTVEASGELAGGILGSGYIGAWADNAVRPNIESCVVTGSITGSNMVGGIQGGDKSVIQTYKTSPNHITGNTFSGVVTATDGQAVGSIVGYYRGLNAYDTISGNFNTSKGALSPIGQVAYLDTSAAKHETIFGLNYFDSSSGKLPTVPGYNWWQRNLNRTDDPLGADAESLCATTVAPKANQSNAGTLLSGKSANLKALDPETGKALSGKQITWTLNDPQDEIYATVSASGTVKAKTVLTQHDVVFVGSVKGDYYGAVYQTITILPKVTQIEIVKGEENVTGKTLSLNAAGGETLELTAKVYPEELAQDVTWKSSNTKVAQIAPDGTVSFAGKTGTVTITATSTDGSNISATVKLQVGVLTKTVTIEEPAEKTLRSGKALTLKAATDPVKPTVSGVTFKLVNASDSAYVTLSAAGKVTAKTVNEPHDVQIIAVSKDAAAVKSDVLTLTILPKNVQSLIIKSGEAYVTSGKIVRNAGDALSLEAYALDTTDGIDVEKTDVAWTSSNAKVASIGAEGNVTCLKAGTAKITATLGKIKATVTVQVTTLVNSITIETKSDKDDLVVASGKTLALKATVAPTNAKLKTVTWSIVDGSSYAKISASGVVTANKNLTAPVTITVKAVAKDGSNVEATREITINPIAQGVTISDENHERTTGTLVWDMAAETNAQFTAKVYPANAQQTVTWKSSNAKIASVDASGNVTFLKTGSVTITATANDGSGKKASFKLNIVKRMKELTLADQTVVGGKTLQLKAVMTPADVTNKKLTWKVNGNTVGAKISSTGKLTTKKVTEATTVTVTVSSNDGSNLTASCTVTITPVVKK